jgi:hypothetical protein
MVGLLFILPILAFDIWLSWTTGRRQVRRWLELRQWPRLVSALAAGLALAIWLTFFLRYGNGPKMRIQGFPIPFVFFRLEDQTWSRTVLPSSLPYAGAATDFLTGLAAPFIPCKIAEFLRKVKAELK